MTICHSNEYIALIRYVSRDGYVLFVPIQWVLQYNPIDFDESLAFIRYSYCNIKIALTKEGTLMLTLLHELYTVVKCYKLTPTLANSIDYMIEKLFIIRIFFVKAFDMPCPIFFNKGNIAFRMCRFYGTFTRFCHLQVRLEGNAFQIAYAAHLRNT